MGREREGGGGIYESRSGDLNEESILYAKVLRTYGHG